MISTFQAAVLGVVQGLTEFLPVSSSAHLVLGQALLGLKEPELLFDVAVHVGTLLAVLVFFWRDLWAMLRGLLRAQDDEGFRGRRLLWLVIVGSVPTAIIGVVFKDTFEALFASPRAVGMALLVTGAMLMATRFAPPARREVGRVGPGRALIVGIVQGLAITPGISRSGSTISTALLLGVERRLAAHYSFLLSIPAICGALLLHLMDLKPGETVELTPLVVGGVVAGFTGLGALMLLVKVVQRGGLHWFAFYCWALGLWALVWRF